MPAEQKKHEVKGLMLLRLSMNLFFLPPSDEGGGKNEVFDGGREKAGNIVMNN